MAGLGHRSFSVLGHDRGARVAYRMALAPEHVERIGILEVVPIAIKAYHWTLLAQLHPPPARMIASDPVAYLEWTLASWSAKGSLEIFDRGALENSRLFYAQPERIREFCEDLSGERRHRPGARRGRFPSQPQDRGARAFRLVRSPFPGGDR
jgi:haloacetate dehalogenase